MKASSAGNKFPASLSMHDSLSPSFLRSPSSSLYSLPFPQTDNLFPYCFCSFKCTALLSSQNHIGDYSPQIHVIFSQRGKPVVVFPVQRLHLNRALAPPIIEASEEQPLEDFYVSLDLPPVPVVECNFN